MRRLSQQDPGEQNQLSVICSLQADSLAGVWPHSTQQRFLFMRTTLRGALTAAAAVGDDHFAAHGSSSRLARNDDLRLKRAKN